MNDIITNQCNKTQKLIRLIPIQKTCKAYTEDIIRTTQEMAENFFKNGPKTFCVTIKIRNNSSIGKTIVKDLAEIIQHIDPKNQANFKTPEVVFNVEIIKTVCCLSFIPYYLTKYKKCNLLEICNAVENENNSQKCNSAEEDTSSSQDHDKEVSGINGNKKSENENNLHLVSSTEEPSLKTESNNENQKKDVNSESL